MINSSSGSDSVGGPAVAEDVIKVVDTVAGSTSVTGTPVSAKVGAGFGASEPAGTSIPTDDGVKVMSVGDLAWVVVVTTTASVVTAVVIGKIATEAVGGVRADSTAPEERSPAVMHD